MTNLYLNSALIAGVTRGMSCQAKRKKTLIRG